jgi:hypothetical protein
MHNDRPEDDLGCEVAIYVVSPELFGSNDHDPNARHGRALLLSSSFGPSGPAISRLDRRSDATEDCRFVTVQPLHVYRLTS